MNGFRGCTILSTEEDATEDEAGKAPEAEVLVLAEEAWAAVRYSTPNNSEDRSGSGLL